jgi:hypothetical protein
MDKIYLKDNYIVTELSGVTSVFGKNYTVYSENTTTFFLNSSFPINNARSVTIDFSRSSSIYNEAGTVAYTTATLRSFFLTNTGFKSPSGGSGGVWGSITGTLSSQTDLQNALDAKQDDLVSGTNIKTLEGQSLLGAGNIDLTKSDVGLSNVDNTSDLNKPISTATQTALNAKQNTLTLTTTGTSGAATLVGSTLNVPQYSTGLLGIHALVPLASGEQTNAAISSQGMASTAMTANRLYSYPFIPAQSITTSNLYINVATLLASSLARILIYSDLNGVPYQKLYESANLDCSTTGIKTATTTFNFVEGTRYWLTLHSSSTQTLTSLATTSLINIKSTGISMASHYFASPTFGSAPTTFVISGTQTAAAPFIGITKA